MNEKIDWKYHDGLHYNSLYTATLLIPLPPPSEGMHHINLCVQNSCGDEFPISATASMKGVFHVELKNLYDWKVAKEKIVETARRVYDSYMKMETALEVKSMNNLGTTGNLVILFVESATRENIGQFFKEKKLTLLRPLAFAKNFYLVRPDNGDAQKSFDELKNHSLVSRIEIEKNEVIKGRS